MRCEYVGEYSLTWINKDRRASTEIERGERGNERVKGQKKKRNVR